MFSRILAPALAACGIAAAGLAAGCATTPGARPHDMGVAAHEAAARTEDARAARLAASPAPPSEEGRRESERRRRMADDHRAAAGALRVAEAAACNGISDRDRDASPMLALRSEIEQVEPLRETPRLGPSSSYGNSSPVLAGAVVMVRAVPGLTGEWLQRTIDCHIARAAALGRDVVAMPDCPLALGDVTARVRSAGGRFVVEVRALQAATAEEVLRRARRLGPHS